MAFLLRRIEKSYKKAKIPMYEVYGCMAPQSISFDNFLKPDHLRATDAHCKNRLTFRAFLEDNVPSRMPAPEDTGVAADRRVLPTRIPAEPVKETVFSKSAAAAAYKKQNIMDAGPGKMSDIRKYKDDQLLSNPGGDHYYLDQRKIITKPNEQESFWGRVGKDLSDAFANVQNFVRNFLFGSKIHYRDQDGQIREARQRGLVGSVVDFFKDVGSAFTFGAWHPDGEEEPQGFGKRVGVFFSKMKEALFGDLIQGVSGSIIHMGEDLLFAGWNLAEVIPDATIGNVKSGRELTTQVFDNGQVLMDYVTDVLPPGEAWVRVHSPDLKALEPPLVHNAQMPESGSEDERWAYVRNTPFRKTIETIGSLLSDIFTLRFLGHLKILGDERNQRH